MYIIWIIFNLWSWTHVNWRWKSACIFCLFLVLCLSFQFLAKQSLLSKLSQYGSSCGAVNDFPNIIRIAKIVKLIQNNHSHLVKKKLERCVCGSVWMVKVREKLTLLMIFTQLKKTTTTKTNNFFCMKSGYCVFVLWLLLLIIALIDATDFFFFLIKFM